MTVIELLTQAGINYKQKENDNVYIECQLCQKDNLSINSHTGAYHCWTGGCPAKGHISKMFPDQEFSPSVAPIKFSVLSDEDREAILHAVTNKTEIIEWSVSRGLDPTFIMNQGVGYDTKSKAMVFPFRDERGNLIGGKFRGTNGDQWIKGSEPLLYLLDASDLLKDKIVIVEGEVDALTLKQIGVPVVATLGAGKDKGLHLLSRIRQVYLGYDMDGSGEAGAEKAALVLGRYRCKRVIWTQKDPNDMLKSGATREDIINALKESKSIATDLKSKDASELMNDYITQQEKSPTKRLSWGYPRLDAFTKGIGGGMFIGVLAEAGTGKTTFIINTACNNAIAGTNVGICSLEEHPTNEVTPKVAATLVGRNPGGGSFAPEEIKSILPQLKRVQLYSGSEDIGSVIDWIKECYFIHDVKLVLIDYLQLLMTDERDTQKLKEVCYAFKKLVKELPELCIVMIIQPKQKQKLMTKDGQVSNDNLDGSDARGGAAINQSVDAMLTIRSVKGHPDVTQFQFTKVRGHLRVSKKEWLNQYTQLQYDHSTLRQVELNQLIYGG